jgi:hypothetical protein
MQPEKSAGKIASGKICARKSGKICNRKNRRKKTLDNRIYPY